MCCGAVIGLLIPQDGLRSTLHTLWEASIHSPADEEQHAEAVAEHDHVELSSAAQKSLNLQRMVLTPTSYVAFNSIPAVVVERPGISDLHVVTEFEGIVEEILAIPGQAVREGDPLFRLRLTGDSLANAQSGFLDAVQQVDIIDQEIQRLESAAEGGGLARKTIIEQEYEKKRLLAQQETRRQELIIRGLKESQIDDIVRTRKLVRTVIISVPTGLIDLANSPMQQSDPWVFTVEDLLVTPGLHVQQGEPLCNLAHHAALSLEGMAFERDLDVIVQLLEENTPVTAELGEDRNPILLEDLRIVHLDNHVDTETQTYRFYLEISNEVLKENVQNNGRRFRSWKFKPGQRGHIRLPKHRFEQIFKVPAAAVVNDGLESVVFRKAAADAHSEHEHHHDAEMDVFEPVSVHILYKDRRYAVLGREGELRIGNVIAANAAYQLLLASKSESAGGHDHHGHQH